MEGKTQETAAAKAGMSVRSARKWQCGPLPSQAKPEHRWRTRPDPFDGVWEDEIEPLLRNDPTGKLKAWTLRYLPRSALSTANRNRTWDTRVGTMELHIPKLREGSYFPSLRQLSRGELTCVSNCGVAIVVCLITAGRKPSPATGCSQWSVSPSYNRA